MTLEPAFHSPAVQHVELNLAFDLHVVPTNDAFVGDSEDYKEPITGDPEAAQWGVHVLNLPGGWSRLAQPHTYLGFIDEGLMTTHPDLRASHQSSGQQIFDGGSFRAHLSRDVANTDTDSDDDGISDGAELLVYDRSDPDPGARGYGDPCSSACPLFADGFEFGDTSQWSSTVP